MGRLTQPIRSAFNEKVNTLRREYKEALKDTGRREAFEMLVATWSSEMGAITYAESISLFDLMLLTAVVEERRMIMELTEKIETAEKQA